MYGTARNSVNTTSHGPLAKAILELRLVPPVSSCGVAMLEPAYGSIRRSNWSRCT